MADNKALAPLQFNRPSTKARPQDPRRFESHDVLSADAQQDPEYRRMVQDIEALQQRQGWLAGRGAFDKDDLLYLKQKLEEERLKEQEQRDSEAMAFAAARARAALQEQEAAKATFKPPVKQLSKQQTKAGPLQHVLRVKAHSKEARAAQRQQQEQSGGEREAKRPKLATTMPSDALQKDRNDSSGEAELQCGSDGKETVPRSLPAMTDADEMSQQPGQSSQNAAALEATAPIAAQQQDDIDPSSGLGGLLCGYGSDVDDESASQGDGLPAQQSTAQQQVRNKSPLQLPPAAELLAQGLPVSGFAEAHQQQVQALAEAVVHGKESSSSNCRGSTHQQHGSWI